MYVSIAWKRQMSKRQKWLFFMFFIFWLYIHHQVHCKLFKGEDKFFRRWGNKEGKPACYWSLFKPTDTQQYPHASSCLVFHSKKSIPYSQAWRLNKICSENSFFDKRYNDLEIWLKGRAYSDNLFRKQILKARKFSRAELLNNQRKKENEDKLVLNIMYHLFLAQLKVVMTRIHILLTTYKEHSKVLRDAPIISKNLKTKVGAVLVKDPDVKLANILHLLEILHHLLQNAHMRLDQKI